MSKVRVLACEEQPIVLEGLAKVLVADEEFEYVGSASSLAEALDFVREKHPDILLIDQSVGLKLLRQFIFDVSRAWARCQPILWVNDLAKTDCFRVLQLGIRGIMQKTAPVESMMLCLRTVCRGDVWIESSLAGWLDDHDGMPDRRSAPRLTPREREIVHQVCIGLKNREIAEALSITASTVKVHLMHVFEKTGVKDRFELAVNGRRLMGDQRADEISQIASKSELSLA